MGASTLRCCERQKMRALVICFFGFFFFLVYIRNMSASLQVLLRRILTSQGWGLWHIVICCLREQIFYWAHFCPKLSCSCCSAAKSCLTLCDPMDCSRPGFPVLHCLPEFAQTHVDCIGDAIRPSHPLSSLSPPPFNLSQRQGLFQ